MDTYLEGERRARERVEADAQAAVERARELFGGLVERLADEVRARPGTVLLVALGLGFVLGRMLKRGG